MASKTTIRLNAKGWNNISDFYDAILPALLAPPWHGHNLNALAESLADDDINGVHQPLAILITNADRVPPGIRQLLDGLTDLVSDLRAEEQAQIELEFEPPLAGQARSA